MKHRSLRGSDLHSPSSELVENNSGSTIGILKAVKFNGMGTVYPQIVLANSGLYVVRGITQGPILAGQSGYITALGFLNDIDTSLWPSNTLLYADNSGNISNVPNNLPVASVLKQDAVKGIIYVDNTGITKSDLDSLTFPDALSLELGWDITHPSYYSEPTYDLSGKIVQSDIWDTSAKALHIFTKVFTYSGAQLTNVLLTRVYDGKTLNKAVAYSIGGQITSVTRTYTP